MSTVFTEENALEYKLNISFNELGRFFERYNEQADEWLRIIGILPIKDIDEIVANGEIATGEVKYHFGKPRKISGKIGKRYNGNSPYLQYAILVPDKKDKLGYRAITVRTSSIKKGYDNNV